MTQQEFASLDLDRQALALFRLGNAVGERGDRKELVILYQLFDFYAELRYSTRLPGIVSIRTDVELDVYLEQVRLEDCLAEAGGITWS